MDLVFPLQNEQKIFQFYGKVTSGFAKITAPSFQKPPGRL